MRLLLLGFAVLSASVLFGCATAAAPKMAWQHYDECSSETTSFRAMVACGKQRRLAYCQEHRNCDAVGDSLVQYADSLVRSIDSKEMTEAEAQRKWIEFKMTQVNAVRSQQLQAQTNEAIVESGGMTCTRTGAVTSCY
jgi:uncharacterized protein YecT (DUF1311 family)